MNQTILKKFYWGLQNCRKKGKIKWQNEVTSQNPHNIADNIRSDLVRLNHILCFSKIQRSIITLMHIKPLHIQNSVFWSIFTGWNRSFIKRQTSGTSCDNEWQRMVQRVTTNDNVLQRMATSGTTSDSEWQRVVQRMTTSANEWPFRLSFFLSNKRGAYH